MKFGQVEDPSQIDFTLPADHWATPVVCRPCFFQERKAEDFNPHKKIPDA